jgi:hypothetical protein
LEVNKKLQDEDTITPSKNEQELITSVFTNFSKIEKEFLIHMSGFDEEELIKD